MAEAPLTLKIPVRHPDWVTCRQWVDNERCNAMNPLPDDPTQLHPCVRCGRPV